MRILFVNPVGAVGGAERVLLSLISSLRALQPAWELGVVLGTRGALEEQLQALGVRCDCLPMPEALAQMGDSGFREAGAAHARHLLAGFPRAAAQARAYARALGEAADAFGPDLVHSNGIKTHLLFAAAKRRYPLVWHVHDFLSERPAAGRLLKWVSRRARLAIAISRAVASDAASALKSVPLEVVYNGVDTDLFAPGPSHGPHLDFLAGMSPAAPQTVRVGLVATYARWKGQDLFLRAAAQAIQRAPELALRFYVVGGPVYATAHSQWSLNELSALSAELGISDRVGFVPFTSHLAPVYRALDVVVHASVRPEPFGMTILEAMACGRPVIASSSGGAAELFSETEALGIAPMDEGSLSGAIVELARDPARRRMLGDGARKVAVSRFSMRRMGEQMVSVYRRLAGAPEDSLGAAAREPA